MNKMIIFAALLLAGVFAFLYSREDTRGISDNIAEKKHSKVEESLSTPVKPSDINSKVSTTLPKDVNSSQEIKAEKSLPLQTNGSVYIHVDANAEPKLEQQEPESDVIDDNVPDSYPVEDAEFYFVPKEERYPGNLGGPPPSPFGSNPDLDLSDIELEPPVGTTNSAPVLPNSP